MSKKQKSKLAGPGYRQFMSGFAGYARENGIHIHGGRGSFAKKAGEVWKDLKGKPAWKDNLDVVLPQYLVGVEGAKEIAPKTRLEQLLFTFSGEQFLWWEVKQLYGLWAESINVNPDVDNLIVVENEGEIDIKNDSDAFDLYNALRDLAKNGEIDKYSYIKFINAELNDNKGIDITFSIIDSTEFKKQIHGTSTFDWPESLKERYGLQKEALGPQGTAKLAKISTKIMKPGISDKKASVIQAQALKLEKVNEAAQEIRLQYEKGYITKADLKKRLAKIYKF